MADLTPPALRWLADHHGAITVAVLRRSGVTRRTESRLVAAGVLRRTHRSVLVIASAPSTIEHRCAVLCAAHPRGFVTGPTAGSFAGLRRMPRSSALHFAVPHGIHLVDGPGIRFRQTTALPAAHRHARSDGIVVPSWPRLAFDLAADLPPLDHLSVIQQLLHERRVTVAELAAIGRRLCHPARPGSTRFAATLERLDGAPASESHPEVVLADALRRRGVPVEPQSRVFHLPNGRTARVDLGVPTVRWGVELDIHPQHRTLDGHAGDAQRSRQLHLVGWQIEPVSELDMQDLDGVAGELTLLYRARCRELALRDRSAS